MDFQPRALPPLFSVVSPRIIALDHVPGKCKTLAHKRSRTGCAVVTQNIILYDMSVGPRSLTICSTVYHGVFQILRSTAFIPPINTYSRCVSYNIILDSPETSRACSNHSRLLIRGNRPELVRVLVTTPLDDESVDYNVS